MKALGAIRFRVFVHVGLVLMLAVSGAWAATPYTPAHPDPVLESWRWRSFPELNGLGLRCLAEGKDKAMWFGVDDGVRRYDGVKWMAYTEKDGLYGAPAHVLCATQDGSVYAGTDMGISRFRDGKWGRVFPPEGGPSTRSTGSGQASSGQVLSWPVNDLMEARDGGLWAGTAWGALRLGPEGAVVHTTQEMASALRASAPYVRISIVPDAAAPARLYGEGIGARVIQGSIVSRGRVPAIIYALAPGGPGKAAGLKVGDQIAASKVAGPQVILTVLRKGRAEPFEVTVARRPVKGSVRDFPVYDVFEDREGAIWLGLFQGEILRYTPSTQGSPWRLYTEKEGLDVGNGPRIAQTRDGVIWTASENSARGVNRFDGKVWTHFRLSAHKGSDLNPSILVTRDGTLWIGGNGTSLHAFRDGAWRVYSPLEAPMPWHRLRLLEASDGALWVAGLGQEAARLDYGTTRWTTYEGLAFQCETPDGAQWFVSQDSSVVRRDEKGWTRHGVEDGLMDRPRALMVTRQGALWAAGSHDSAAATARFDGGRWSVQTHPRFSQDIYPRVIYESPDNALWFGAMGMLPDGQGGGLLRFDGAGTWTHYAPPEAPGISYGIGQTADGVVYTGGTFGLRRFDGRAWMEVMEPREPASLLLETVYAAPKGDLWVGTRTYGAFHYDGKTWTRHDTRDGLMDNQVTCLVQTADGSVWAATSRGVSRFDGKTWAPHLRLPDVGSFVSYSSLRQSRDGAIWINAVFGTPAGPKLRAIRYEPTRGE